MYKFVYNKIEHLISPLQFDFVQKCSTTSNLASMLARVGSLAQQGGQENVVYLDVKKAFDKIPHWLLLSKLKLPSFGLSNELIAWFQFYITESKFMVKYNDALSSIYNVTSESLKVLTWDHCSL